MGDILMIAIAVLFFLGSIAYVQGCVRLGVGVGFAGEKDGGPSK